MSLLFGLLEHMFPLKDGHIQTLSGSLAETECPPHAEKNTSRVSTQAHTHLAVILHFKSSWLVVTWHFN